MNIGGARLFVDCLKPDQARGSTAAIVCRSEDDVIYLVAKDALT